VNLNFAAAIAYLQNTSGRDFASTIANGVRPDPAYVFTNTVLPTVEDPSYFVQAAGMLIRSTMAGLVGMDSIPGPVGAVEMNTFLANTAKFGGLATYNEATIRKLQSMAQNVFNRGGNVQSEVTVNAIFNFVDKFLRQPIRDTWEYLAVRACMSGAINWTFEQKTLAVNYGVPAGNLFAQRTLTQSYVAGAVNNGTASVFWADWRAARKLLGGAPLYAFATRDTIEGIADNPANNFFLTNEDEFGSIAFDRIVNTTIDRRSEDVRNRGALTAYDQSGNIFDLVNRGKTIEVPFLSDGYIILIGRPRRNENGLISNRGDQEGPTGLEAATPGTGAPSIGYTHVGPTVEGGGQTGIYANVWVPTEMPMQLHGHAFANGLPFILQPDRLVVLRTTMT
jgi:hypothetical protein